MWSWRFFCFYIIHHVSKEGMESICVTNELAGKWGLSAKSLYIIAEKNTPILLPPIIDTMEHTLELLMGEINCAIEPAKDSNKPIPMHIMTNKYQINGASVLLYHGLLDGLAEKLGTDLYVIPSSIHEVILVPESGTEDTNLNDMVAEVNHTQVDPKEVLADHVYYYDRKEDHMISCVHENICYC